MFVTRYGPYQAQRLATLERAIKKATLMCGKDGKRTAAFFLAWRLGMSQGEIAEMAGLTQQRVSQRIGLFWYYLLIACRQSPGKRLN